MLFIQDLSYKMKDIIKIFLPMIGKGCLMIYCCSQDIDSFAKGISFALNFKEQAERFMNKKYDY